MNVKENEVEYKYSFRTRYSIIILLLFGFLIYYLISEYLKTNIIDLLIMSIAFIIIMIIISGIKYVIVGEKIIFKLWFIKTTEINVNSITYIARTYNPLSSCAASFKRLELTLEKGNKNPYILISPSNEKEFLEVIKKINPNTIIEVENKKGNLRVFDWDI